MSTLFVVWNFCSIIFMAVWLLLSLFGGRELDDLNLFSKNYRTIKMWILSVTLGGFFWPIFFENLGQKTMICRKSGQQIVIDALVMDWTFRELSRGDFLVLDSYAMTVWKAPRVSTSTPDGDFKLVIFLKFDGSLKELIEEAQLLAPCVPKGESNLIPMFRRKFEAMMGELGDRFPGVIMEPGFRLCGYRVDRVEVQAPFPETSHKLEPEYSGDTNIIDLHKQPVGCTPQR